MKLDSPILQKGTEEIRGWDCKTAFNEIAEKHDFVHTFVWLVFFLSTSPLDDGTSLKETLVNQIGDSGL